jgi:hypothetical protein
VQEDGLGGLFRHGQVDEHLARRVEHRQPEPLRGGVELLLQRGAADARGDAADGVADEHLLQRGGDQGGLALAEAGHRRLAQLVDARRQLLAHPGEHAR